METLIRLLLDETLLPRLFLHLAWIGPLLGAGLGTLWARRSRRGRRDVLRGLFLGLLGTVNAGLWVAYNAITDRLGLDRVLNLLLNLGMFLAVGLLLGLAWRRLNRP